jgi:SpoVK/Ycf46/Vps4 family AAA+-type ATPase
MANYKARDLKIYAVDESLAGDERNYRNVFDRSEVSFIWAEFSFHNKLVDERNWRIDCLLRVTDKQGKIVCSLDAGQEVRHDEAIKVIRVKWGADQAAAFWNEGEYRCEAWVGDELVIHRTFHITDQGQVLHGHNPYFKIDSIRFFEGPSLIPDSDSRKYASQFPSDQARFIWMEMKAENRLTDEPRDWPCEIFVSLFTPARQLKSRIRKLFLVGRSEARFDVILGWGDDEAGTWKEGTYRIEMHFMELLLASMNFSITPSPYGEKDENGANANKNLIFVFTKDPKPIGPEEAADLPAGEAMAELNALIGLDTVKSRVNDLIHYAQFVRLRKEKGLQEADKINLNAVFTGNPGTGKTIVAKLLGGIFKRIGLLPKGHLVQADRSDLVGEYIGQTAPRTRALIQKALGGVLFIDEAYSLQRKDDDARDYGREVIEILLKQISEHEGELAVILAGYPQEMESFMSCNPGLKSRFGMLFEFPDYAPQELRQIAELAAKKRGVEFSPPAVEQLNKKLVAAYRDRDRTFGNARFAISLVDEAKINMALRLMQLPGRRDLGREALSRIEPRDVEIIRLKKRGKVPDIPIDEALLDDTLKALRGMVGLEAVKHEIEELVKLARYYREIGKDIRRVFSLHSVFMGNPGTGKTTVARLMADVYKALGILERGHLVECERSKLVAGYVGQTAEKTNRLIDRALGGVLFIDEAYALSRRGADDFGMEAVETLLKRMDDDRGLFVVIVAGYARNMDQFMESNPGLKSRFDRVLHFNDYSTAELNEIALCLFAREGVSPVAEAGDHLRRYFAALGAVGDPNLGNARVVRRVCEKAIRNHDLRLAAQPVKARKSKKAGILILEDVQEFSSEDTHLKINDKIGFC